MHAGAVECSEREACIKVQLSAASKEHACRCSRVQQERSMHAGAVECSERGACMQVQ